MTTRTRSPHGPEQLSLLAPSPLPVQFRLDQVTRQRGLAHVAEIRRQLTARQLAAAAESPRRTAKAA
jgi:hypothetical protein